MFKKPKAQKQTTEVPEWVRAIQQGYGKDLSWLRGEARGLYESGDLGELVDMPEEWQQALAEIEGGGAGFRDSIAGAKDKLSGMGDYTDDVVETTLAGMQRQAERDRLAREGRAAAVGGTSNTRAAVGDAVADQLTGMNMAEMEAKLRQQGREMTMEEAEALAGLGETELGGSLNLGGAIGGIGDKFFDYDQAVFDKDKNAMSWLGSMYGAANPVGLGAGNSTTTMPSNRPSTFSQIAGIGASILGGFLSDEEAKENVRPMEVGLDALKDVRPSTYDYKGGMPTHKKGRQAGLMAQDLEHIPGAVEMGADGYRRVDPYPVLATVVQAVKELDARTS